MSATPVDSSVGPSPALRMQPVLHVVDDDPGVRRALNSLGSSCGLHVQTYDSAAAFMSAYRADRPGCLLLDVRMPDMSGLELQGAICRHESKLPVIVMTAYADVPLAVESMRRGAFDFIEKPFSASLLLERVQAAVDLSMRRWRRREIRTALRARLEALSNRERQIIDLIVAGKETKEVARSLELSPKTVEYHKTRAYRKLEVTNIAQLVRMVLSARKRS
jgi:RNA polymerase sigma factor (sigma-70 family)